MLKYDQKYTDYQLKRSIIRKKIRKIYLKNILKYIIGKTIDFGCGIGELLSLLPDGSIGYEVNEATVRYCKKMGLNVEYYNPELDNYELKQLKPGEYSTLIMSHVLEHLNDPVKTLNNLFQSCNHLDLQRIIIIVPGEKGFQHDKTHRIFINYDFFIKNRLKNIYNYSLQKKQYFPINLKSIGKYFKYHELIIIYDKKN